MSPTVTYALVTARPLQRTQHGEGAVVTEVDQSPAGIGFTISGCCDELIDRAHSAAAHPADP